MAVEEILKHEANNHELIWKHPCEDFNVGSQLIVHEKQEAIFLLNGQIIGVFGSGRHTLSSENIPFLKNIINVGTGGKTPFHAEVYFVNKVEQLGIKWGTESKVSFIEPTYNFPLSLGASGEFFISIDDGTKLFLRLLGTENLLNQDLLVTYFKSFMTMHIKSILVSSIMENKYNIFTLDTELPALSQKIKEQIENIFLDYGVKLERFFVANIVRPDGDPVFERFKSLYFREYADIKDAEIKQKVSIIDQNTEAQKTIIEAEALAKKRSIEGYTYHQERGFDVAEKMAQNEGVGEFTNLGIGMGLIGGVGSTLGNTVSNAATQALNAAVSGNAAANTTETKFCSECGTQLPAGAKFCSNCGVRLNTENKCNNCGHLWADNEKFCPDCGNKR